MKKSLKSSLLMLLSTILIVSIFPSSTCFASSKAIPTMEFDYYLDGPTYEDPFSCGDYSLCCVPPNVDGTKLTVRIDATTWNPKYKSFRLYCYDSRTNKEVGSKGLNAQEYQYATFTGLDSGHTYYFRFQGASDVVGHLYVTENGLYPFKSKL